MANSAILLNIFIVTSFLCIGFIVIPLGLSGFSPHRYYAFPYNSLKTVGGRLNMDFALTFFSYIFAVIVMYSVMGKQLRELRLLSGGLRAAFTG